MQHRGNCGLVGVLIGLCVLAMTVTGGCSKGGYSGPIGTVTGKVTLDGKPAPQGCAVTFLSEAGHTGSAKVGADGSYTVMNVDKPEMPVGKYKVAVAQPASEMSGADYDKYMSAGGGGEAKTEKATIPAKFQNTETSELSFDVKEGPNTINIDLK